MRFSYFAVLIASLALTVTMATDSHQTVTVTRSDDGRWLEVYHDGKLTSEWQPSDGAVYELLETLLGDELGPYPTATPLRTKVASQQFP